MYKKLEGRIELLLEVYLEYLGNVEERDIFYC